MQDIPQSSTSQLAGAAEGETAPGESTVSHIAQLPVALLTSPAFIPQGRNRRSRKDRPCDTCAFRSPSHAMELVLMSTKAGRRHKHLCTIPVKGEPCAACSARSRPCTFTIAPTQRVRKPAVTGVQVAPGERVVDAIPPAESETSAITPFASPNFEYAGKDVLTKSCAR